MAKKSDQLSFSEFNSALKAANLKMSPAIQAQLDAANASLQAESSQNIGPSMEKSTKVDSNLSSLNSNIVKLVKAIEANTKVLDSKSRISKGAAPSSPQDLSESQLENQKTVDYQTELLEQIVENTKGVKVSKSDEESSSGFSIGGILTGIALALGTAAGIFLGQLKAFMTVMKLTAKAIGGIGKFLINLIPESIRTSIVNKIKAIKTFFVDLITKIMINLEYAVNIVKDFFKNRFGNFITKLQNVFKAIGEFFGKVFGTLKSWGSKIIGAIKAVRNAIISFFRPIVEAAKIIKQYSSTVGNSVGKVSGFFKGIGQFFTNIGGKLGAFSKVFGAMTKIISKLAYPITIIMGAYDAIVGAIKGFETGGLVGGIKGFIKGAWNSIVSSFLDLIKDMVSWVLGAVGFKDAEKWLDSWSFEGLFDKFWDMVFTPFEMIQDFFMNLEIPKFSIPVLGEFGPYKIGSGKGDTKLKPAANSPVKSVTPQGEANKVYRQSADNKEADKAVPLTKPSTTVVNTQQVNNQTQNAFMKTSIRNNDVTHNRYLNSTFNI